MRHCVSTVPSTAMVSLSEAKLVAQIERSLVDIHHDQFHFVSDHVLQCGIYYRRYVIL